MEYRFDFVLSERSLEHGLVGHIAAYNVYLLYQATRDELTPRNPIAHQAHDLGTTLDKARRERAPQ
jgi:hypothetical protein